MTESQMSTEIAPGERVKRGRGRPTGTGMPKSGAQNMPVRDLVIDDERWHYAEAMGAETMGGQRKASAYIRELIDRDRKARII